jgi:hypothetical protein
LAGGSEMSEDFNKQLSNFVNALIALAPSRNYVTQFLYLIKMNSSIDYRILEEAYPELMKDEYVREALAKVFGVVFKETVSLDTQGYGSMLVEFIGKVITLFEEPEFRSRVNTLLKSEYPEGIPNLAEEWVDVRLKGLLSEPNYGKLSIKVLKEVMKVGRIKREEVEKALGIRGSTLIECLNLLDLYKLITKDYDGSYRPSDSLKRYPHLLEGIQV